MLKIFLYFTLNINPNVKLKRKMKRSISLGETIGFLVVVLSSVALFWKNTDVRLTALEIRVQKQEQDSERIITKLDELQKGINEVKVALQDKQDRP